MVYDIKKICEGSNAPEMILYDANSAHHGNRVITMTLLANHQYLAVAYGQGHVIFWDLKTQKIVKKIRRTDAEVLWLSTKFSLERRALDIIYNDGIVDRYFIPECASISHVLNVLETKFVG